MSTPRVELNGIHQDDGEGHKLIKRSTLLERRKKINDDLMAKVYAWDFVFASQDAIECVIKFRLGNHTLKRGAL